MSNRWAAPPPSWWQRVTAGWPGGIRWLVGGIAAATFVLAIAWVLFVPATDWLAHHDVGAITGQPLRAARDAARGRLLTLGAGLLAAGALLFTARNFTLSRRTFELTEQSQVTDRYTKAIEQLGSDKLDVRIGGIYALERIARDSARDHPTVMEVLSAFIREHSREPWPAPGPDTAPASNAAPGPDPAPGPNAAPGPDPAPTPNAGEQERPTRPDVQAAVTVIGRRDAWRDIGPIDLTGADLSVAILVRADLSVAILVRADLSVAILVRATLDGTNLARTDLRHADLTGAHLTGAHLTGAHLTEANLSDADLTDAIWPQDSAVPEGWQLDANSGRLKRAEIASGTVTPN